MQCKKIREEKENEEPAPDEDGPASSSGAEELNDETDVESATSSEERTRKKPAHSTIYQYDGYFEHQREAKCAIHALNNCLGGQFCTDSQMEEACEDYFISASRESLFERRDQHCKPGGWYSSGFAWIFLHPPLRNSGAVIDE